MGKTERIRSISIMSSISRRPSGTPSSSRTYGGGVAPITGPFDGLLLVDKPAGPTSHDVVAAIRRGFDIRKVGHGGTLDPSATGLLILLLGKGTSLSNLVMGGDKRYEGIMRLGVVTDSQDMDGKVLEEHACDRVDVETLRQTMRAFVGDIYQTPPMVSAIKHKGVPLYKLARKGRDVPREPRLVHIYDYMLHNWSSPLGTFSVACGKGTYIRTLCHDLGQKIGCGAALQSLRRTQSGTLKVENALPLDQILSMEKKQLAEYIIPYYRYLNNG